jgi:hypothetical protein
MPHPCRPCTSHTHNRCVVSRSSVPCSESLPTNSYGYPVPSVLPSGTASSYDALSSMAVLRLVRGGGMRVRTGLKAWWPSQELLTRSLEEQGAREVKEVEALQGPHGGAEAIKATPLFRLQRSGGVPHCFRYPSHPLPSHRALRRQRLAPIGAGATLHRFGLAASG